jgi:hypothetical protein
MNGAIEPEPHTTIVPDPIFLHIVGSRLRARLLTALLTEPARLPWMRQLGREVGCGFSALAAELRWLRDIGMIRAEYRGGACFYIVDETHPLVAPLRSLLFASEETHSWRLLRRPWLR